LYLDLCRRPLKQERHTESKRIKDMGKLFNTKKCEKQRVTKEESEGKTEK
jgi:hypothetical protein